MPKDIRYLSKRRINQLISSQTAKPLRCKNHNGSSDLIETCTVGYVSNNNNTGNKNKNDAIVTNSFDISDNSNVSLNDHIDKEIIYTDLNVHNVNININPDIREELSIQKRTLANDLKLWVIQQNISHTALNYLLEILRIHGHKELPSDARTLM